MTFTSEADAREALKRFNLNQAETTVIPSTHGCWVITDRGALNRNPQICSICFQPFYDYPNNAQPVNDGQCCKYCDDEVVTPARMALAAQAGA